MIGDPEYTLRKHLDNKGVMSGVSDDLRLYTWLKSLNTTQGDHRSGWERRLQERLHGELFPADA